MVAYLTMTLLLLIGVFLIFIVLLQRGRGGGLAGALGGMGGQSAFGTKAGDVFTRITVILALIWIVLAAGSIPLLRYLSGGHYTGGTDTVPALVAPPIQEAPGEAAPGETAPGTGAQSELPASTETGNGVLNTESNDNGADEPDDAKSPETSEVKSPETPAGTSPAKPPAKEDGETSEPASPQDE